jgi:hypothetical protein
VKGIGDINMEPTLEFIAKQLERVLTEQQIMRGEIQVVHGEIQIVRGVVNRLDYAVTDILDRLRRLEGLVALP